MYKFLFSLSIIVLSLMSLGASPLTNTSYVAERGRDFNRSSDFNRTESPNHNINRNEANTFDHGAAYGADRGAEYGAAAGAAAGTAAANSNSGVPINPNAAEQDMLYYSGAKGMVQGQ